MSRRPRQPRKSPDAPAADQPVRLDQLAPDPSNPREISADSQAGLSHSLETFGELGVISFNLTTGQLVAGHQRVQQLIRRYGPLTIERIDEEFGRIVAPDDNTFIVRFVRWDSAKQQAANVAANAPTIQGRFVDEKLELILSDIRESRAADFDALMLSELYGVDTHGGDDGKLRDQPVQKAPTFAWVLVGIPLADYGEINAAVEALAQNPKVTMSITANNGLKN